MGLIRQSEIIDSPLSVLNRLVSLPINEVYYSPNTVNVIYNDRLDSSLIQLESFMDFSMYNNITDAGRAIALVCQANEVPDTNKIGFVVNEQSLYADRDIYDTYMAIHLSDYIPIYIAPISEHSVYSTKLKDAISLDKPYNNLMESENILSYIENPIYDNRIINEGLDEARASISRKLAAINKEILNLKKLIANSNGEKKVYLQRELAKLNDSAAALKKKL